MYPKDSEQRKKGSRARAIIHYQLNSNNWDFKEETGNDVGRDCIIELSENDEWKNNKVECQIKGRSELKFLQNKNYISFPLEVKTVNYAKSSSYSFLLLLVDLKTERIYFECIQDYLLKNNINNKLENQNTVNILLDINKYITPNDKILQFYAKKRW